MSISKGASITWVAPMKKNYNFHLLGLVRDILRFLTLLTYVCWIYYRLIGPTLGYFLASFCLKKYVNLDQAVDFGEKDPR